MAIGYLRLRQGGATIDVPVVNLGASPLPSNLRVKVPAGIGELPLVYPDDSRASKILVRQGGVTYAVAQDERTSVVHGGPFELFVPSGSLGEKGGQEDSRTLYIQLGTTQFNRVTRVEVTLTYLKGGWICTDTPLISFGGWDDFTQAFAWLELRKGGTVAYRSSEHASPYVRCTHPGHGNSNTRWHSVVSEWSGSVTLAIDTQPDRYDVWLGWRVWVRHESHNDGGYFRPIVKNDPWATFLSLNGSCNYDYGRVNDGSGWVVCRASQWTEIARG